MSVCVCVCLCLWDISLCHLGMHVVHVLSRHGVRITPRGALRQVLRHHAHLRGARVWRGGNAVGVGPPRAADLHWWCGHRAVALCDGVLRAKLRLLCLL